MRALTVPAWRLPLCEVSSQVEMAGNSASNLASRAVWKNQISLEGLISAFSLFNRCHHVLKSQQSSPTHPKFPKFLVEWD